MSTQSSCQMNFTLAAIRTLVWLCQRSPLELPEVNSLMPLGFCFFHFLLKHYCLHFAHFVLWKELDENELSPGIEVGSQPVLNLKVRREFYHKSSTKTLNLSSENVFHVSCSGLPFRQSSHRSQLWRSIKNSIFSWDGSHIRRNLWRKSRSFCNTRCLRISVETHTTCTLWNWVLA
jgi:hypothetical protein